MKTKRAIQYEVGLKEQEVKEITSKLNFGHWNFLDRNRSQRKQQLCAEISVLKWVLN